MPLELEALKKRILENPFVDRLRIEMRVDEAAYEELSAMLTDLAAALRGVPLIDKELALVLYSIPQTVSNAMMSFDGHSPKPAIAGRLEDAWVELDALVLDCLSA